MILGSAGQADLLVTRPPDHGPVEYVPLWRRRAPVRHVTNAADAWLTVALGVPARLMAFASAVPSLDGPSYEVNASLQDATPFHLTSQDSLDDLNRRIGSPIPMNRFRPNVVLAGAPPYAEDGWREIRLGPVPLRWIKPCTRCKMTMTDQETGGRSSAEPLRTLATYRRFGAEVVFGHYFVALSNDRRRIGDQVQVSATHESPLTATS